MTRIIAKPGVPPLVKASRVKSSSPTSLDVARKAGVSRSIVSGVLNGTMSTMRVSEETRERVLAAARELGYTPNPVARALRRQRSNVIGYVPRIDRDTPYDSPVPYLLTRHLANAGAAHGYHIVEASTRLAGRTGSDDLIRFLAGRHVDGVVLDSPESAEEVARIIDRRLPIVQMIRPQRAILTPAVMVDPVPGITEAIGHLLEMGHRDIAFIGTRGDHPVDRDRIDTFRQALATHGIPVRDEWVALVETYNPRFGREAAMRVMSAPQRPTAIFIAGDNLASGALQYFYEHSIRIPDDLSVISYDDLFAAYLIPALTSVHQPLADAADKAIEVLIAQIESPGARPEPEVIRLPSRLVERHSVRRINPA